MVYKSNIVLIGFMGCGKTLTSEWLAKHLNLAVISTDQCIEQKEGRSITDIFKTSGEDYFRQLENKIVAQVSDKTGMVIDCGGGIVLNSENIRRLKKNGRIFYLCASPETIYANIKDQTHRPLLNSPDPKAKITELLNERQALYEQAADVVIDANKDTIEEIANAILEVIKND